MHDPRVPDGGFGWVIVAACFLANTLLVGMPRSFGVIYIVLIEKFETTATETAVVHALFNTLRMVFGPLSSLACERWGCRPVVMFGGILLGVGVMCMAFATNIYWVYLTYGTLAGFGGAFIFTPSLIVIGQYFSKKKGIAMAISTLGSGLGTMLFAPLFHFLFATYGFFGASWIVGAIMLNCVVAGALLRPVDQYLKPLPPIETVVKGDGGLDKQEMCQALNSSDLTLTKEDQQRTHNSVNIELNTNSSYSLNLKNAGINTNTSGNETTFEKEKSSFKSGEDQRFKQESGVSLSDETAVGTGDGSEKNNTNDPTVNHLNGAANVQGESDHTYVTEKQKLHLQSTNFISKTQALDKKSTSSNETTFKSRCILRLSLFWNLLFMLYSLNIACMPFCIQMVYLFLPMYVEENGLDKTTGAWIVAAMGTSSTVGRIVLGAAFDTKRMRYRRRFLHSIIGIVFGLASAGVGIWQSMWPITVFAALSGFFEGGFHGQRATVLSEMVKPQLLTLSVGYMIFAQGVGNTLGPLMGGIIRDYTETYNLVFFLGGLIFALSSLIMLVHYLLTGNDKAKLNME